MTLRHDFDPDYLLAELRRIRGKYARKWRGVERRVVTLEPAAEPRGEVLFSYVIDPFVYPRQAISLQHTQYWESWAMARTYVDLGCRVDVIHWTNQSFVPRRDYDVAIDVRLNLARWAERLPAHTVKVMHIETSHPSFHNPAQRRRLKELEARRGVSIRPQKMIEDHHAIEAADCASALGNTTNRGTYAFAGKPLHPIPISVPLTYPWPEGKDFAAARRRFLWFGSGGLVHKGLDRVLEAFAGLPEHELWVCGPIRRERDFERAYFRELYQTPNIHTVGWIDIASPAFVDLTRRSLGVVYPSCSEADNGGMVTCMHAGLIPLINAEVGFEIDDSNGVPLPDCEIETLRDRVRGLAARDPAELEEMARGAWEYVRARHTRDHFQSAYRRFAERLLAGDWRTVEERP